jgi:hypothetical protein
MDRKEQPIELAQYQWQNRLLLLFAPSQNHSTYQEQRRLLDAQEPVLEERDLLVLDLLADSGHLGRQKLSSRSVVQLRERFGVPAAEFTLLLVGKDGTVKRRETSAVPAQALFDQVDSMPMRLRELRGD